MSADQGNRGCRYSGMRTSRTDTAARQCIWRQQGAGKEPGGSTEYYRGGTCRTGGRSLCGCSGMYSGKAGADHHRQA